MPIRLVYLFLLTVMSVSYGHYGCSGCHLLPDPAQTPYQTVYFEIRAVINPEVRSARISEGWTSKQLAYFKGVAGKYVRVTTIFHHEESGEQVTRKTDSHGHISYVGKRSKSSPTPVIIEIDEAKFRTSLPPTGAIETHRFVIEMPPASK